MSLPASDTRRLVRWHSAPMTIARTIAPLLLLSLASACTDGRATSAPGAAQPAPSDAPPALAKAHEAYLAGDYVEMGERLKEVLADERTGELARDNAFALLESANEATKGKLPARAPLPTWLNGMSFGVMNGSVPFNAHRLVFLKLRVAEGSAAHLKDIRVTRLPNEPILGLAEKRGGLHVSHGSKGFDDISFDVRNLDVLPDRGAFTIHVEFDDGRSVDTFVLANKLVVSAQPELTSPAPGQVFKEPRPEIAWRPYRSPELSPWETRALAVGISREPTNAPVWDFYKDEPADLASVRVDPAFEPGAYWINMMFMESRSFGGVHLTRMTQQGRPFDVVR